MHNYKTTFKFNVETEISIGWILDDQPYGKGLNGMLREAESRKAKGWSHKMEITVTVREYDGVLNTPIGAIQSWKIKDGYPVITKEFTAPEQALEIITEVEHQLLDYWKNNVPCPFQ